MASSEALPELPRVDMSSEREARPVEALEPSDVDDEEEFDSESEEEDDEDVTDHVRPVMRYSAQMLHAAPPGLSCWGSTTWATLAQAGDRFSATTMQAWASINCMTVLSPT